MNDFSKRLNECNLILYFKRLNEHKFLLYIVIPFFLTYFISHFTLIILGFLNMLISDFEFIENYKLYISTGSMLTTSISILVTACIGYYFSPLKPTATKITVFKVFILLITLFIAAAGIFTYIMSSGIISASTNVHLPGITYLNFIYSMIALIIFNVWNFKADAAKNHTEQEAKERANLHR